MTDAGWRQSMFRDLSPFFIQILAGRRPPQAAEAFLRAAAQACQRPLRALDLGCGSGRFLPALSAVADLAIGLDYSLPLIGEAQRQVSALSNVATVVGDMLALPQQFAPETFGLILKAYTSLGYFPFADETRLLAGCRRITRQDSVLIIDTFNSRWIAQVGRFERRTVFDGFALEERYLWSDAKGAIVSRWNYISTEDQRMLHSIDFDLEGYDVAQVDRLLAASGWRRTALFADYDLATACGDETLAERLVVTAVPS